ncbi:MAG: esterase [Bacteroidetes bacterium]|nr:esterase [Rhodothermaceae bacterium RA]RMH62257.1 MAG: esterase [Bacteroidota bacterium]
MPSPRHYTERLVPFTAGDGMRCTLVHLRGSRTPDKGPVLLVHGAGVRANIFRAPVPTTIVDALIEDGYDVWLENWRASIDLPPNEWTLDQAALYDHPKAVETVAEASGAPTIKAIIHCQGSTSFTMAAMAGLVPQVSTIVSNAVSLHPVVPRWSAFKLTYLLPVVRRLTPYLNPRWGDEAPGLVPKLIDALVELTHHECDNGVCKHVSFSYGSGFPALWSHENLNEATHDWLRHEFAHVPMTFYRQIVRCIRAGHLVTVEPLSDVLPEDYAAAGPKTTARFAFFAGEDNRCFLPESQIRSHRYFDALRPGYHTLHLLPGYGHLDVFMGRHAGRDVFPLMLDALSQPVPQPAP